jgi:hypothetical protein
LQSNQQDRERSNTNELRQRRSEKDSDSEKDNDDNSDSDEQDNTEEEVVEIDTTPATIEEVHPQLAKIVDVLGKITEKIEDFSRRQDQLDENIERTKQQVTSIEANSAESGEIAMKKLATIIREQMALLIKEINNIDDTIKERVESTDFLIKNWEEAQNISWNKLLDTSLKFHVQDRTVFQAVQGSLWSVRIILDKIANETKRMAE